jgi:hypothetical protein
MFTDYYVIFTNKTIYVWTLKQFADLSVFIKPL